MKQQTTRLFLAVFLVATSACMPDFGTFDGGAPDAGSPEDGGPPDGGGEADGGVDVDGGGEVDGGRDGGVEIDAGAIDGGIEVDGGEVDGGEVDGGEVDGGLGDGGIVVDAGLVDAGPVDAGIAFDAGPCQVPNLLSSNDWSCLSGPTTTTLNGCAPTPGGAVVDIERSCEDMFVLTEAGIIHTIDAAGDLGPNWASCEGVENAPARMTDLDVRGEVAIAYEKDAGNYCVVIEGECTCYATSPAQAFTDLRFVFDDLLVGINAERFVFELPLRTTVALQSTNIDEGQFAVPYQDQTDYRVAVFNNNTTECFENGGGGFDVSNDCPVNNAPPANSLLDVSRIELTDGNKVLRLLDIDTGIDSAGAFLPLPNATGFGDRRTVPLEPYFRATAFAGFGQVDTDASRIAIGGSGGVVLTAPQDQDHLVAPLLPRRAHLGTIHKIVHAPNGNAFWGLADNGIWDIRDGEVSTATFYEVPFSGIPTAAVEYAPNQLMVAFNDGSVQRVELIDQANSNPIITTQVGFDSGFVDLLVKVETGGLVAVVAFFTDGSVWQSNFANTSTPPDLTFLSNNSLPTALGFHLAAQDTNVTGTSEVANVWLTARTGTSAFQTKRIRVTASPGGIPTLNQGTRSTINTPEADAGPFRFFFLKRADPGSNALGWVTASGDSVVGRIVGDAVPTGEQSQLTASFDGVGPNSSGIMIDRDGCATVIDSGVPQGYNHTSNIGSQPATVLTYEVDTVLHDAVAIGSGQAVGVGAGGNLFRITYPAGGCNQSETPTVVVANDRPARAVTSLNWRNADEVVVADEAGRIWVVHQE